MRKLTHLLTLSLMAAAMLISPALVERVSAQEAAAATPSPQDKECDDLYAQFYAAWTKPKGAGQPEAYPIGKQYIEKCGTRDNDYTKYVKKQVAKFEDATAEFNFAKTVAQGAKAPVPDVYKYGKELLGFKPNDPRAVIALGFFGGSAYQTGDKSHVADATSYSKQAIQLIDAGTVPAKWDPFLDKEQALGWLNYGLGAVYFGEKQNAEAISYLYRATQVKSDIPKAVNLYYLAEAYRLSEVEPAYQALKKFEGQDVTPESTAAQNKWYQVMDRASDFYARAYSAAADATSKQVKDNSLEQLTIYYKIRHNNEDKGLTDFIAKVNQTPIPDPKSPLPALPVTPAAPATSAGGTPTGAASTELPMPTGNGASTATASGKQTGTATKSGGAKSSTKAPRNK